MSGYVQLSRAPSSVHTAYHGNLVKTPYKDVGKNTVGSIAKLFYGVVLNKTASAAFVSSANNAA